MIDNFIFRVSFATVSVDGNQCSDIFALHYLKQIAVLVHVEDDDRQSVVATECRGGEIHYLESFAVDFIIGDLVELRGGRIFFRVGGVDTVYAGTFQHDVGFDFDAA